MRPQWLRYVNSSWCAAVIKTHNLIYLLMEIQREDDLQIWPEARIDTIWTDIPTVPTHLRYQTYLVHVRRWTFSTSSRNEHICGTTNLSLLRVNTLPTLPHTRQALSGACLVMDSKEFCGVLSFTLSSKQKYERVAKRARIAVPELALQYINYPIDPSINGIVVRGYFPAVKEVRVD